MTKKDYELIAAALVDLMGQLEGIGIYIPGEDEGQWSGTEGLSFSQAHHALKACGLED